MGVDFNALLFYGMPVDSGRGWDLIDEIDESSEGIAVTNLDSWGDPVYMLIVRGSSHSAAKNDNSKLVKLSDITGKESEWRELIKDACVKHGLTFVEPDWYFATRFS